MTNHILCNFFDKFDIEMYMLLNLSFLLIIQYIMALQLWGRMKKEATISGCGGTHWMILFPVGSTMPEHKKLFYLGEQ